MIPITAIDSSYHDSLNRNADIYHRYLVFTSKHHDGFLNWPSSYSFGWNSMDLGPRKNVLKELKQALSRTGKATCVDQ